MQCNGSFWPKYHPILSKIDSILKNKACSSILLRELNYCPYRVCIGCSVNGFQAIALLLGQKKGVHISLKNGTFCPLFSHDTNSFKDTCLYIYLKEAKVALYVLNGQPNMPVPTLFRPLTVERQLGIKSGSCKS
jgi:hypothetical protein